jgi:hypothetical protein
VLPIARLSLALLGLMAVATPAAAQTASCLESGLGLYSGWHTLHYRERVRLCREAEHRELDRADRLRDWEAARLYRNAVSDPEWQRWRQQECLVNAAACDIPGVHSTPPPAPPPPPPPPGR